MSSNYPHLFSRGNRILLLVVPLLFLLAGVQRLPVATANTINGCPASVGTDSCGGPPCTTVEVVRAGTECSGGYSGICCLYNFYNVRCREASAVCADKYYGELVDTYGGYACVVGSEGRGICKNIDINIE